MLCNLSSQSEKIIYEFTNLTSLSELRLFESSLRRFTSVILMRDEIWVLTENPSRAPAIQNNYAVIND